jgi:hypothetical protein
MGYRSSGCSGCLALSFLMLALSAAAPADEGAWAVIFGGKDVDAFEGSAKAWEVVGSVEMDAANPRKLTNKPGEGVIVNSQKGASNLITKQKYIDVETHVEFLIPKGSNSGVKMMGLYEIQILDSFGKKELTGDDCGGIYPRAEEQPKYHHIDKGVPPKVNACKPAGEWQSLDIIFKAPRFDADDKKIVNAKFLKVVLNGQVVHENVEVLYPTGAAWRLKKEIPTGPLFLQGDHGPVAFRNVRIRPYSEAPKKD